MGTRRSFIGAALGALLIASLTFPASGADLKGTLAFVNGISGKRVDVCLNGREIKSGLAYGRAIFKNVIGTGAKNLKFYERDPRTCRGKVLAKDSFAIGSGEDVTIVATRKAPKVLRFDNAGLGEDPAARHSERVRSLRLAKCRGRRGGLQLSRLGQSDRCPRVSTAIFTKGQQNANDGLPGPEHGLPVPGHRRWGPGVAERAHHPK